MGLGHGMKEWNLKWKLVPWTLTLVCQGHAIFSISSILLGGCRDYHKDARLRAWLSRGKTQRSALNDQCLVGNGGMVEAITTG